MSVDAASLRTVAVQLRALAADKDNQPIIARDEGCMSALSNFVQSEDPSVCEVAVGALMHLSSHKDNKEILRNDFDVWDNLQTLACNKDLDKNLRTDAIKIMKNVADLNDEEESEDIKDLERRAGLRMEPVYSAPDTDHGHALIKEPLSVRIHVPGLSDAEFLDNFEHRLIRAKGILSVSYEMGAEVVVIFTRISAEDTTTVVREISGRQIELLPEETEDDQENDDAENSNNGNKDGYVDEERERYRKHAEKAKRTAVSQQGFSSLAQRLEAERKQAERENARSERMLGRIGRGFTSGWGFW